MTNMEHVNLAADKAAETHSKIKSLNKQYQSKKDKKTLEEETKKLKDEWWESVKHTFVKDS